MKLAVKSGAAEQLDVIGDLRKCSERVYESFVRGDQAGLDPTGTNHLITTLASTTTKLISGRDLRG